MKKKRLSVKKLWRPVLFFILASSATLFALLYQLVLLAPALSPTEQTTLRSSSDWHFIITDPTHLVLKILQWTAHFAPMQHTILFARLPSVLLGILSVVLFTFIMYRWHGRRSMLFGFCIFICSAWVLHVTRFAGPDIEFLTGILALLAAHVGLADHEDSALMHFCWLAVNVVLLFVPGFVWYVLLSAGLQPRVIANAWQTISLLWQKIALIALACIGVAVPIVSIVRTPALLWPWLGLPAHLPSWRDLPAQFGHVLAAVAYQGPYNPELWLGRLPLLDIMLFAMLVAGIVFYGRHWRAARTRLLGGFLLVGIVLLGTGGAVSYSLLMPILYLIAVAGLTYIVHFWLKVFPRNPVARSAGIGLVACIVALSCTYSLWQYFVAWPHNPEAAAIYHSKHQ